MTAEEILALARRLAEGLKDSDEHRRMLQAREAVGANVAAQIMLRDFRAKQVEFQTRQLMGQEVSKAQEEEFRKLTEIVMLNPAVRDYLYAEQEVLALVAEVQRLLAEAMDLDLDLDRDHDHAEGHEHDHGHDHADGHDHDSEGKGAGE